MRPILPSLLLAVLLAHQGLTWDQPYPPIPWDGHAVELVLESRRVLPGIPWETVWSRAVDVGEGEFGEHHLWSVPLTRVIQGWTAGASYRFRMWSRVDGFLSDAPSNVVQVEMPAMCECGPTDAWACFRDCCVAIGGCL